MSARPGPIAPARAAWVAVLGSALVLGGCGVTRNPRCAPGEQTAVSEWLYFGTARPKGSVSAAEWSQFLAGSVTPRFPAGLTVWPAAGQWQSADGTITREDSFVLNLVHPATEAAEQGIGALIGEYKARFQQEAVLRVRSLACVSL